MRSVVDELCCEGRLSYLGLNGCCEQMRVNLKWSVDMYTYIPYEEDTT